MKEIINQEDLEGFIKGNPAVLLYFYNDNCAPCLALRPKVSKMIEEDFPKMKLLFVNAGMNVALASAYGVFASPTILIFFDGRETFRASKYISIQELHEKTGRYYNMLFG